MIGDRYDWIPCSSSWGRHYTRGLYRERRPRLPVCILNGRAYGGWGRDDWYGFARHVVWLPFMGWFVLAEKAPWEAGRAWHLVLTARPGERGYDPSLSPEVEP